MDLTCAQSKQYLRSKDPVFVGQIPFHLRMLPHCHSVDLVADRTTNSMLTETPLQSSVQFDAALVSCTESAKITIDDFKSSKCSSIIQTGLNTPKNEESRFSV